MQIRKHLFYLLFSMVLFIPSLGWAGEYEIIEMDVPAGKNEFYANSINNEGVVVGWAGSNVVVWEEEIGFIDISKPSESVRAFPNRINDSGVIVGFCLRPATGEVEMMNANAFVWEEGVGFTDIHPTGWVESHAAWINNAGVVVGWCNKLAEDGHSTIYNVFTWKDREGFSFINPSECVSSQGFGINDSGAISGACYQTSSRSLFIWDNGVFTDLGVS